MKNTIEYSVIGNDIEEHFDNYQEAENFVIDLGKDEQMDVQFFSKEWNGTQEGEVVIFKNFGEQLN